MSCPAIQPDAETSTSVKLGPGGVDRAISQRYYKAVNQLVDELKKQNKRATDYAKTALWHETSARKIEQLSILYVDKEILAYGADVAVRLRAIANSLRGVPIRVNELAAQKYLYVYDPWGWGGWWGWRALSSSAPGFIRASSGAPIRWRVDSVSGRCSVTTSASASTASNGV